MPGAQRHCRLVLSCAVLRSFHCSLCLHRGKAMFGPFGFRLLPWDYGVRNLLRRPARSALTLFGLTVVVLLVLVVVGFIRGLGASLSVSGDPQVVLIHTLGTAENIENSSIPGRTASLLSASLGSIQRQQGPGGSKVVCA